MQETKDTRTMVSLGLETGALRSCVIFSVSVLNLELITSIVAL